MGEEFGFCGPCLINFLNMIIEIFQKFGLTLIQIMFTIRFDMTYKDLFGEVIDKRFGGFASHSENSLWISFLIPLPDFECTDNVTFCKSQCFNLFPLFFWILIISEIPFPHKVDTRSTFPRLYFLTLIINWLGHRINWNFTVSHQEV